MPGMHALVLTLMIMIMMFLSLTLTTYVSLCTYILLPKARQMEELEAKHHVQGELLSSAKAAVAKTLRMNELCETQLMEAEDHRAQVRELNQLQREYDLLLSIQQSQLHSHDLMPSAALANANTNGNVFAERSRASSSSGHFDTNTTAPTSTSTSTSTSTTTATATATSIDTSTSTASTATSSQQPIQRTSTAVTLGSPTANAEDPVHYLCRSNSNSDCPNVAMEGWLTKRSTHGSDSWKERYVRLRCFATSRIAISYFEKKNMDTMKRRMFLLPSCKLNDSPSAKDPLLFRLTGVDAHDNRQGEIELMLRASNMESKRMWFDKLVECVQHLQSTDPISKNDIKASFCRGCHKAFSKVKKWRYHCYYCGESYCFNCLDEITTHGSSEKRRRCEDCLPEASTMSHRLSVMKQNNKSHSHSHNRARANSITPGTAANSRGTSLQ